MMLFFGRFTAWWEAPNLYLLGRMPHLPAIEGSQKTPFLLYFFWSNVSCFFFFLSNIKKNDVVLQNWVCTWVCEKNQSLETYLRAHRIRSCIRDCSIGCYGIKFFGLAIGLLKPDPKRLDTWTPVNMTSLRKEQKIAKQAPIDKKYNNNQQKLFWPKKINRSFNCSSV